MKEKIKKGLKDWLEILGFGFLVFGVPMIIYFLVKWDPIIYREEEDGLSLGFLLTTGMWWVCLYFFNKHRTEEKRKEKEFEEKLEEEKIVELREQIEALDPTAKELDTYGISFEAILYFNIEESIDFIEWLIKKRERK